MLIPNFPRQMAWQREREKLLFLHQIMTSKDNKTSHSKSLKNMTHVLMVPPFTVSPHLPCIISFPQEARWMGGLLYYIFTSYYIFTFKIKSTKSKNYITSKRTINIYLNAQISYSWVPTHDQVSQYRAKCEKMIPSIPKLITNILIWIYLNISDFIHEPSSHHSFHPLCYTVAI